MYVYTHTGGHLNVCVHVCACTRIKL